MNKLAFNVTNRCNFKCKTCLRVRASRDDMLPEDVERVLPSLRKLGIKFVAITGGEPILNPGLPAIMRLLSDEKITFNVVTNGWYGDRYLSLVAPFAPNFKYFAVSLDGHNAALHDANRKPGSFDRAMESIRLYRERGYKVVISHIVNRLNAPFVREFLKMMHEEDLTVHLGAVLRTSKNGDWTLTGAQRMALRAKLPAAKEIYGEKLSFATAVGLGQELPFCQNLYRMNDLMLRYDGCVCFCCDALPDNDGAVLGNIREQPLEDMLVRFADVLGAIARARLQSMMRGDAWKTNDCDFCNEVMRTVVKKAS